LIELDKSNGKKEQDPDHHGIRDPDGSYLHEYELDTPGIDTVKWPTSEPPIVRVGDGITGMNVIFSTGNGDEANLGRFKGEGGKLNTR
jgi:hypothetical protein